MDTSLDLTPFGYTPTESSVYVELLSGGPSSGYAIAKRLSIARANAYQALDGLVGKGAAQVAGDRPKRYRATRPEAVLAQVIDRHSRQLDRLEQQIAQNPSSETEDIVSVEGQRAIVDLAMRTAARNPGPILCVGSAPFLSLLGPAWRRRATDGRETKTWRVGPGEIPSSQIQGEIPTDKVEQLFKGDVFLLAGIDSVVAALVTGATSRGIWSSEPALVGSVKGAIAMLTGSGMDHWQEF